MAALTGNAINTSYQGLLKTTDNGAIGATAKLLTDGLGNNSTLSIGTAGAIFTGTLDLTGATVTGLPVDPNTTYDLASAQDGTNVDITLTGSDATVDTVQLTAGTNITLTEAAGSITIDAAGGGGGSAGLISGTQTDSMESAGTLTTIAAQARGVGDIVLGQNAASRVDASNGGNTVIGKNASQVGGEFCTVYGIDAIARSGNCIAIGAGADAAGSIGMAIGNGAENNLGEGAAIGMDALGNGNAGAIALGRSATTGSLNTTAVGRGTQSLGAWGTAIGFNTIQRSDQGVAIGYAAETNSSTNAAIAIGDRTKARKSSGIAIGAETEIGAAGADNTILIGRACQTSQGNHRIIGIGNDVAPPNTTSANDTVIIGSSTTQGSNTDISNSVQIGLVSTLSGGNATVIGRQAEASADGATAIGRNSLASGDGAFAGTYSTAAQTRSAAFNGVASTTANTTAVANLEVIGNGNSIKLTSPNGTVFSVTVSDAGALVVA